MTARTASLLALAVLVASVHGSLQEHIQVLPNSAPEVSTPSKPANKSTWERLITVAQEGLEFPQQALGALFAHTKEPEAKVHSVTAAVVTKEKEQKKGGKKQRVVPKPNESTSLFVVSLLGFFGAAILFGTVLYTATINREGSSHLFGLVDWPQRIVFFGYCALWLVFSLMTHAYRDVTYSSALLVAFVFAIKLVASVVLLRVQDGTYTEMFNLACREWRTMALYIFPAAAYALSDTLTVVCVRAIDPATFNLLFNIRFVAIAFAWQFVMSQFLTWQQWSALFLISLGAVFKELPYASTQFAGEVTFAGRFGTYGLILIIVAAAAFAAVANEKLLKGRPQVPLNLQNIAMYSFGLCVALMLGTFARLEGEPPLGALLFSWEHWQPILSFPCVLLALLLATFGITTAHFLKKLNNIARESATGILIIATIPLDFLFFGYPFTMIEGLGVAMLMMGLYLYNLFPVTTAPAKVDKTEDEEVAILEKGVVV